MVVRQEHGFAASLMLEARKQQGAASPQARLVLGHVDQDVAPHQTPGVLAVGQHDRVLDAEGCVCGLQAGIAQDAMAVLALLEDHEVVRNIGTTVIDQLAGAAVVAVLELRPEKVPPEQVVGHHLDVERSSWAAALQTPTLGWLLGLAPEAVGNGAATRLPSEGVRNLPRNQLCWHNAAHWRSQLQHHALRLVRKATAGTTRLNARRQRR
mmetsp:Transcript_157349/g.504773  ORF Transcript_157349/g.504773 Transcript_157349/m.504773 type:complete len:210 (-) Transcript_157349:131-760(-)